jgi:16S rRNA (guanine(966)-N(2))-methyltransferase RsmD
MRIIAGRLKGRRLKPPAWSGLRPTSDRLRETLFNVLGPSIAGARVLDLYAGTGALGIEALSRGAELVVFVDCDRRATALVADNLVRCGLENGYAIIRARAAQAVEQFVQSAHEPFDIVLLDPPYAPESRSSVDATLAATGRVLARTGVAVLEHPRRRQPPAVLEDLVLSRSLLAGDSVLSFYGHPR